MLLTGCLSRHRHPVANHHNPPPLTSVLVKAARLSVWESNKSREQHFCRRPLYLAAPGCLLKAKRGQLGTFPLLQQTGVSKETVPSLGTSARLFSRRIQPSLCYTHMHTRDSATKYVFNLMHAYPPRVVYKPRPAMTGLSLTRDPGAQIVFNAPFVFSGIHRRFPGCFQWSSVTACGVWTAWNLKRRSSGGLAGTEKWGLAIAPPWQSMR